MFFPGLDFIFSFSMVFHDRGNPVKCFSPAHSEIIFNIVGSLHDLEVASSSQTVMVLISNPVSGGQSHRIHLTILRRFLWPSLVYICI